MSANFLEPRSRQRRPDNLQRTSLGCLFLRAMTGHLAAQWVIVVVFATNTSGRRQFLFGTPGEQPRLHILMANVVTCLGPAVGLTHFGQHALLVGNVRL